jgi:hypothetical protein
VGNDWRAIQVAAERPLILGIRRMLRLQERYLRVRSVTHLSIYLVCAIGVSDL